LWVELFDDLFRGCVLLDLALEIEAHHVARIDLGRQLEELGETLFFSLFEILRSHGNHKVDVHVIVVFLVVL
jgi:hypothetical protein